VCNEASLLVLGNEIYDKIKLMVITTRTAQLNDMIPKVSILDIVQRFKESILALIAIRYPLSDNQLSEATRQESKSVLDKQCTLLFTQLNEVKFANAQRAAMVFTNCQLKVNSLEFTRRRYDDRIDKPLIKIHILTKTIIPDYISAIINKGLKFLPFSKFDKTKCINTFSTTMDMMRRVIPPVLHPSFDTAHDIGKLVLFQFNQPLDSSSFDKEQLSTFLTLNKLVLKDTDKNMGPVIMDFNFYEKEVKKHLEDRLTYKPIDTSTFISNNIDNLQQLISLLSSDIKTNLIGWNVRSFNSFKDIGLDLPIFSNRIRSLFGFSSLKMIKILLLNSDKLPKFYCLMKVHKIPLKSRPIIPNFDSATTCLSKFLDTILQPLLNNYDWIVTGTLDTIDKLQNTSVLYPEPILISGDVVSLYTNLQHDIVYTHIESALKYDRYERNRNNNHDWHIDHIISLLIFLMKSSFFKHDNIIYKQMIGLPMGTNVAPTIAQLVLGEIERQFDKKYGLPKSYLRFIDDTFFVLDKNDYINFQTKFVTWFETYKLEWTWDTGTTISFLDISISLGKKSDCQHTLNTQLFKKPGSSNTLTDPLSNYPKTYKFGWIKGECIRLVRLCSNSFDFDRHKSQFRTSLISHNYPLSIINQSLGSVLFKDRATWLLKQVSITPKNPKFLTIPHKDGGSLIVKQINRITTDLGLNYFKPILLAGEKLADIANKVQKSM